MAGFLASNGRTSGQFDNIQLIHPKMSNRSYFEVRFHSMFSKYENSKNRIL